MSNLVKSAWNKVKSDFSRLMLIELWRKDTWTNNDTVAMTSELYSSTSEKSKTSMTSKNRLNV